MPIWPVENETDLIQKILFYGMRANQGQSKSYGKLLNLDK